MLRGVRAFPTGLRSSRPLAGRLSGTSCSIRHRAPIRPPPTPRPTSRSTSPCPPPSTTDSRALDTRSLVLGPRRPSAHGLGPSDHPTVLSPSRPFTLPAQQREFSPLPPLDLQPTMPFGPIGGVGLPILSRSMVFSAGMLSHSERPGLEGPLRCPCPSPLGIRIYEPIAVLRLHLPPSPGGPSCVFQPPR
jgi:hypothetical protein